MSDSREPEKYRIENDAPVQGQNIGDHNTTNIINKTTVKTKEYVQQHPLTAGITTLVVLFVLSFGGAKILPSLVSHTAKTSSLVGTWTGCMLVGFNEAEFKTDGTADLDDHVETYTFNDTQIEFNNTPNDTGPVEYSAVLSPSSNVLTFSNMQETDFCVMARFGSSGDHEILSSIVGTWTGDCHLYANFGPGDVQFQQIVFLNDGTFTLGQGISADDTSIPDGTYSIPASEIEIQDYATIGLYFGIDGSTPFYWEVSTDGKTLDLGGGGFGGYSCSLTRS